MYRNYQIFVMFLKLDLFFFIAFSVQLLSFILLPDDYEFWLTIVSIPVLLAILILSIYGAKNEKKAVMWIVFIGCCGSLAYFIFKLWRFYDTEKLGNIYLRGRKFLTLFASISIFMILLTMIASIVIYRQFGKGLKEKIRESNNPTPIRRTVSL